MIYDTRRTAITTFAPSLRHNSLMPVAMETASSFASPRPSAPPHKLWTREECAVVENIGRIDLQHYELIEGELVLKMGKNQPHMRAVLLLVSWLRGIFGQNFVVQEPAIDLRPEDNPSSEPEPDAIVLNRSFLELTSHARPEELQMIAEVSGATLSFDLTAKARLYARSAIAEYWVLDLTARRLIVHREPANGVYKSIVAYEEHERVATLGAPATDVCVGDLF